MNRMCRCENLWICESSFPLLEFREKKIVLVTRGWQHCGELAGWWPKPLREVCPWQLLPQSQNVGKYKMQNWKSRISTKSYNQLCQYIRIAWVVLSFYLLYFWGSIYNEEVQFELKLQVVLHEQDFCSKPLCCPLNQTGPKLHNIRK